MDNTMKTSSNQDVCCIECGAVASCLYKTYHSNVIKITHCKICGKVVDKYIEYELVIIFLDAVLHKPQAYRHILFNIDSGKIHHKLLLIYILFDTYLKWDNITQAERSSDVANKAMFYAAMELDFYRMLLVSLLESVTFFGSILLLIVTSSKLRTVNQKESLSIGEVYRGLVISSYGKLFVIPAVIWGQTHSSACLILARIFIFTSNVAALKVLCDMGMLRCIVLLGIATSLQIAVGQQFTQYM